MTKRKRPDPEPLPILWPDTPEHVAELERLDAAGRLASGASYRSSRVIRRKIPLRSPKKHLHIDDERLPVTVGHFWQWLASDLLNNTLRGKLVEFAIGHAINALDGVRATTHGTTNRCASWSGPKKASAARSRRCSISTPCPSSSTTATPRRR